MSLNPTFIVASILLKSACQAACHPNFLPPLRRPSSLPFAVPPGVKASCFLVEGSLLPRKDSGLTNDSYAYFQTDCGHH
jgi:hypothetical protein